MKIRMIMAAAVILLCSCGNLREASYSGKDGYDSEEKVNVGYGTMDRKDLTYSVDQVDISEREISSYNNIWDYLRTRLPGVEIGPAEAGQMPSITIRGKSSINSPTEPLIMVDGVETPDISFLSPGEVASVSVLKDGSAAIYGSRGGNGVILITTKGAKMAAEREAAFQKEAREAARAAREARKAERKARKAK